MAQDLQGFATQNIVKETMQKRTRILSFLYISMLLLDFDRRRAFRHDMNPCF